MKMYKDGVGVEAMESQLEALTDAGWSSVNTPRAEAPAKETPKVEAPVVEAQEVPEKEAEPVTKRKLGK